MMLALNVVVWLVAGGAAFYAGVNLPLSIACGFMAAACVNLIGASINLYKIGRRSR